MRRPCTRHEWLHRRFGSTFYLHLFHSVLLLLAFSGHGVVPRLKLVMPRLKLVALRLQLVVPRLKFLKLLRE